MYSQNELIKRFDNYAICDYVYLVREPKIWCDAFTIHKYPKFIEPDKNTIDFINFCEKKGHKIEVMKKILIYKNPEWLDYDWIYHPENEMK